MCVCVLGGKCFSSPKCEQNAWAVTHHRTTAIVCSVILKNIDLVSAPFPLTFRHKACKHVCRQRNQRVTTRQLV